jgi:SAM-dependent methyltransferase
MIYPCWICVSSDTNQIRPSSVQKIDTSELRISSKDYGQTAAIYECTNCGFWFCPEVMDPITGYEGLVDAEYASSQHARDIQYKKLIKTLSRYKPSGDFLDVGAGLGGFVRAAKAAGFNAFGVEPSKDMCALSPDNLVQGTIDTIAQDSMRFDVICLIDVIEHVVDPLHQMQKAYSLLKDDGIVVLVTPDVSSWIAKLLKFRWWHFRLAHISYFTPKTLSHLLKNSGFKEISRSRPAWYLPIGYLQERLGVYIPFIMKIPLPNWLKSLSIPINFFDSMMVIAKKENT